MDNDESKAVEETLRTIENPLPEEYDLEYHGMMEDTGPAPVGVSVAYDDTGKTPAQILAELGVTQEELDATFPPDYVPLKMHPSHMIREDLLVRAKETSQRLKNHASAKTDGTTPFPNAQALTEQYLNAQEEAIKNNPGWRLLLDAIEVFKNNPDAKVEQGTYSTTQKLAAENLKSAISALIETDGFDAKVARTLYLNKIREQSRLTSTLLAIKRSAEMGRDTTNIEYLPTYDRIKLQELGFKVTRMSGQPMAYSVSWGQA